MQPAHARKAANTLGWLRILGRVEGLETLDKKIPGLSAGDEFTETNTGYSLQPFYHLVTHG
jgi:hypothetical protein